MNFIYYVYAYLRKDGTPYYIGKGKNKRAWENNHCVNLPITDRIVLIESNLSEIGAFAIERRLISWYGRKDLGTGILRNLTDGGDGASGRVVTIETREKLSKSNLGQKRSKEACNNIRDGQLKRAPFTDELKQKLSEAGCGKIITQDHKEKLSVSLKIYYATASEDVKTKRRLARIGKTHSPESIEKIRIAAKQRESAKKLIALELCSKKLQ